MPFASNDGLSLYYELKGSGEPLLLLTGLGGTCRSWTHQLMDFAASYLVIAIDPRGAGRSTVPSAPYGTSDMAADAIAVLDALGIGSAHVLGLGLGGMVAQRLALDWSERVAALILACSFARTDVYTRRLFETWAELLPVLGWERLGRLMSLWTFTPRFFEDRPDELDRLEAERRWHNQSPQAYRAQVDALLRHDTEGELAHISSPTLVLVGEEDIETPLRFARVLADGIPGAELRVLPQTGHRLHIETPDLFNRAVLDFLARHPLGDTRRLTA